jgi:RHS repeat-associated protein
VPPGKHSVGHPVDLASGVLHSEHQDVFIPGQVDLDWERRYSTSLLDGPSGPLGSGWTTRYFATLMRTPSGFELITPEGGHDFFDDPAGSVDHGGVIRNVGSFQELRQTGNRYVLTRWNVDTGAIDRYVFALRPIGEASPLASIENVTGHGLDLYRDDAGRLLTVRQRLERRALILEYTRDGRIANVSLGAGGTLARYEYDATGRLAAAFDSLGHAERYEYDEKGRMVRELRRDGGVFGFRFDSHGRCVRASGLERYDEKILRFHDASRWTEVTDSVGNVSRYEWNGNGQITTEQQALGVVLRTEYDQMGRIVKRIGAHAEETRYEYDDHGNRSTTVDPVGNTFTVTFAEDHQPVTLTDPAGGIWRWLYDASGRAVQFTDSLDATWTIQYDQGGNPVSVTNPTGASLRRQFDSNGVLQSQTDYQGNRTQYDFDKLGRLRRWVGPGGDATAVEYDSEGNPLRIVLADSSTIYCIYDDAGNLTSMTDGAGRTTRYRYGTCHRLLEMKDPIGRITRFEWGSEPDQLERIVNERGEVYGFEYGALGQVVREVGFDGREQRFVYDLDRCAARINALGESLNYKWDPSGRLMERSLPDGSSATFTYTPLGDLATASCADGTVEFVRDIQGRVVRETQGGYAVETAYDTLGKVLATRTNLGHQVAFTLDDNGLLTGLKIGQSPLRTITRNQNGQEVARELSGRTELRHRYDVVGRLVEQSVRPLAGPGRGDGLTPQEQPIERVYGYDGAGLLRSMRDGPRGGVSFKYDDDEHLIQLARQNGPSERLEYDETGNLAALVSDDDRTTRFLYQPGDRLEQRGDTRYVHDQEGRLVRKIEGHGGPNTREWTYTWDALDQLRSVRTPAGAVWRYSYDALGRRILKQGPEGQVVFVWNGNVVVHEVRDQNLYSSWVFDPDSFRPLFTVVGSEMYAVVSDHLGTPRELFDRQGKTVWSALYSSWGETVESLGDGVDCPVRFPGQWFDEETGLHYNRYRYYDPQAGRYISCDPIRTLGGFNLYAYAQNPINWFDPGGLCPTNPGASDRLPPLKGKSAAAIKKILAKAGFTKTSNATNPNETWTHPDGSKVLIHPYGNAPPTGTQPRSATDPNAHPYKTANNAHVHKVDQAGNRLSDTGQVVPVNSAPAHIGIPNPPDLPTVRGRPHGAGDS